VEWVSEWGMWISLCDVGEVSVANVGSDASGVDSRFFPCHESHSTGDTMGGVYFERVVVFHGRRRRGYGGDFCRQSLLDRFLDPR
jgi:hypothetical protein